MKATLPLALFLAVLVPATASADDRTFLERLTPDFELYFVTNIDSLGRDAYAPGLGGSAHGEFSLIPSLGLHLGATTFVLIADELPTTFYFGSQLGFRVHWTRWFDLPGDGWIDAHHTFGRSGGVNRHGIDWATGYEFQFTRLLGLGPYLRFQYVPDPGQNDPVLLMAGITANLMPLARTQSTLPDEDLDGVPDERDVCPEIPFGEYMDTSNEGCPARDRDRDGLLDPVDACPSESMWPYPGDEPDGCPLPDADGDGVPDEFDACPETFAPDGGDALREGCAVDPGF